jgi:hypothetical protein
MKMEQSRQIVGAQKRPIRSWVSLVLVGSLCLGFGALGCGSGTGADAAADSMEGAPAPSSGPADQASSGSISLALDVGSTKLDSVSYTIIGGQFQKSGALDVSNSARISGVIGGIPFGNDYVVTLNAASSSSPSQKLTCSGSAAFQVPDEVPVQVLVHVTCNEQTVLAATPAPIPPWASLALCLALLGTGLGLQRRTRPSTPRGVV